MTNRIALSSISLVTEVEYLRAILTGFALNGVMFEGS